MTRVRDDSGSALVEFIGLSLLLLIPLVYLVIGVGRVQAGVLAAESAAASAARAVVVDGVRAQEGGASAGEALAAGEERALAAVRVVSDDFGVDDDAVTLTLECAGTCLTPGSNISARVTVEVSLPGVPGFLAGAIPPLVTVSAVSTSPVDSVVRDS